MFVIIKRTCVYIGITVFKIKAQRHRVKAIRGVVKVMVWGVYYE